MTPRLFVLTDTAIVGVANALGVSPDAGMLNTFREMDAAGLFGGCITINERLCAFLQHSLTAARKRQDGLREVSRNRPPIHYHEG